MPLAREWDAAILKCLTRLFQGAPPHERCFLSGPGGLDIRIVAEELALLRCLSCSRAVDCIRTCMPALASLTLQSAPQPLHAEIDAAWHALPAAVRCAEHVRHPMSPTAPAAPTPPPPSIDPKAEVSPRRALTTAFTASRREDLFHRLDDVDRVLLEASSSKGARAWADATPTYANRQMSSTHERIAFSIWLGAEDVAELAGSADPRGRDLLRADSAGRVHRHTAMVDAIGDLEREAKCSVWPEVTGMFMAYRDDHPAVARGRSPRSDGAKRRIDLVAYDNKDLAGRLIDPTIVDPATYARSRTTGNHGKAPQAEPGGGRRRGSQGGALPRRPPRLHAAPSRVDHPGGHGRSGALGGQYIAALGHLLARRRNGSDYPRRQQVAAATKEVRERIGVALMRALGPWRAAWPTRLQIRPTRSWPRPSATSTPVGARTRPLSGVTEAETASLTCQGRGSRRACLAQARAWLRRGMLRASPER